MNNPDKEIEEFWLGFKQSMNNFYDINKFFERPIVWWSNKLNQYQREKNYEKIQENIKKYISLYAMDLLRSKNDYYINILITNISRWNNLSIKYSFSNNEKSYCNFIFVLLDIYKTLYKDRLKQSNKLMINEVFDQFEVMILYKDYSPLIKFAVINKKPNILDKLFEFDETIYEIFVEEYNLDVSKNSIMKGTKLIKLIKCE